jgi:tetratricopeptide (TPR) repeat protein
VIAIATIGALLMFAHDSWAQTVRTPAGQSLEEAERALAAGDLDRGLTVGTAYLQRYPQNLKAKVLLIRVHLARGEWDAAYRIANRAARAHPSDVDVLYYLGLVTRRLASDEFQRLARVAPDSARVHQLQAEMFEAQERRADAEKEYAAALAATPDLLEGLLGLAKLKRIRLACEEAVQLYEKAESIRQTFDAAYGLGVCHSYLQNDEMAVKKFEQAVRRNPSAAVAWAGWGTSLVKLRRTGEGITKLQRAIALEPAMYEAHYALGMAYQASGDAVRAQDAFKKAEQLRGVR